LIILSDSLFAWNTSIDIKQVRASGRGRVEQEITGIDTVHRQPLQLHHHEHNGGIVLIQELVPTELAHRIQRLVLALVRGAAERAVQHAERLRFQRESSGIVPFSLSAA
jgi:hypothetical protein